MGLGLLLRLVQHIAYPHRPQTNLGGDSFLQGVAAASDLRRFLALCVCGVVAGLGWWSLYRFARPLVPINDAIRENGRQMPFLATVIHALLQIVTVGLGSPLGREVAPRELSAVMAIWCSAKARLNPEDTRIIIACGAGAGLAAVYNAPLGGTLFALEVLLGTFQFSAVIPALATSAIATAVAWLGLGNTPQYVAPSLAVSASLVVRATVAARADSANNDWRLPVLCAAAFPAIGVLAFAFPQLLGNGNGLAQAGFEDGMTVGLAALLLLLRFVVIIGALWAGAAGGLLTPGLSIGGLLGIVLGTLWQHAWPGGSLAGFALVGSAAFLASSMKMPLTAIVLTLELTRVGHDFLIPISLAVAGSFIVFHLLTKQVFRAIKTPATFGLAAAGLEHGG